MNAARAENIIKYRTEIGPFQTREELKKVKAIGPKTFEQCAGFIRIDQTTAKIKGKSNILDSTWVRILLSLKRKICLDLFEFIRFSIGTS